ncbi:MAG TPA: hypothetical protein VH413_04400 [Verrucomicrobiae bacterium]|jgi:hypothetical protein|nr:hypothetical protein [Verrucomicrobiae bacterium]
MKPPITIYTTLIASLQLLLLCGCINGRTLRIDYENYSEAYGNAFNKQLLLNLARESEQDPVYFLQLGSISSQYQFSTSGGLTPSATRTAPIAGGAGLIQRTLTLGGSFNTGATQTPVFQFLPITGSNYVQALLELVSDKVFWAYYDQGWEADWLVRMMVDSIRVKADMPGHANQEIIYFNDPTDPTFPEFLEFCNELRDAQFYQTLVVEKTTNAANVVFKGSNPKLSEVVGAIQAGLSVENESGVTTVKAKTEMKFELKLNELCDPNEYKDCYACDETTLSNSLAFARKVRTIEFTIRTFESIMNNVACEEDLFTNLYNTRNIRFTNDAYGPIAVITRSLPYDVRPGDQATFTNRPILMIKNEAKLSDAVPKLVEVTYDKEKYSIGDCDDERFRPYLDSNQNRTVFALLSYLFSQTAINTQNLPIQQLIQVQ